MPHRGECLSPSQPLPIPIYSLLVRAIPPNGELLMIGKIDAYTLLGVEAFFSADFGISRGSCPYEVSYNRYERVNTRVCRCTKHMCTRRTHDLWSQPARLVVKRVLYIANHRDHVVFKMLSTNANCSPEFPARPFVRRST